MEEANFNAYKYMQMIDDARQEVEQEREHLTEMTKRVELLDQCLNAVQEQNLINVELQDTIKKQQETYEKLIRQLSDEKSQRAELEMKLAEMKKISDGMAKKASEEAVLGFLRTYVTYSKRKTPDKRAFAKQASLEAANANGLTLPPDLAAAIEALDDEQAEPKTTVTVHGNYNDIHDNGTVNQR